MGAWNTGPFDSDPALDFLGDLAHNAAAVDDGQVVPGSVKGDLVQLWLNDALVKVTQPEQPKEWRSDTCAHAYAAAGLVAAALTGQDATAPSGTRLFASIGSATTGSFVGASDPVQMLGLEHHCGYVALLDAETAEALREPAAAALAALNRESWILDWNDTVDITDQIARLAEVLTTAGR